MKKSKKQYDSFDDIFKHIRLVRDLISEFCDELSDRGYKHDDSKLSGIEKRFFDIYTPKLAACTYGSDEYKQYLKELKPALDLHYANNRHHPEHFKDGVNDMNLVDIVEMFIDWFAATEKHKDGNIYKSISINEKRFKLSPQLVSILRNTVSDLFSDYVKEQP